MSGDIKMSTTVNFYSSKIQHASQPPFFCRMTFNTFSKLLIITLIIMLEYHSQLNKGCEYKTCFIKALFQKLFLDVISSWLLF